MRNGFFLISIHALLAESDALQQNIPGVDFQFLSTLSLRRATGGHQEQDGIFGISIHALLAESDVKVMEIGIGRLVFLSTLSLRRATLMLFMVISYNKIVFLSTLSLRRATSKNAAMGNPTLISIHALLAESDLIRP